ncbi:MAG: reverse transcriptase family protein [gamma proteobacterium symbiont of Lucinoma myriamae]|nr:reverse transcriptase family protein [gamma proteobacterium symbiont of Lucinoma myriamae]
MRKSGGIGVFVKSTIASYVTQIDSDSDFVMWFKLDKSAFNTDEDIYFGSVYVPPSVSRFNNPDEIAMFEVEISRMCICHKYVHLMGDFNARTYNKTDFVDADDFFSKHFEYDDELLEICNISDVLDQLQLSRVRTTNDIVFNSEGNKLLDICKSNNLVILNGRCGDDKSVGAMTFRNCSLIDYSIATYQSLFHVVNFHIYDVDSLFSDGHSLLETELNFNCSLRNESNSKYKQKQSKPTWKPEKKIDFVNNLDRNKLQDLHNFMSNKNSNLNSISKNDINSVCDTISDIFNASANVSITVNTNSDSSFRHKTDRPWYGHQCRNARKRYHLAKKINNRNPTQSNKQTLNQASKSYKKKMNFHIYKYKKATQAKLRNMKNKNPKDYWKLLNNIDHKTETPDIKLDVLYTFFKNLNDNQSNEDEQMDDTSLLIDEDGDELLNSYITESEILKCIKSLKNNKACSNDNIINEYIKNSTEIMMPIYVSFFNMIFNTGILPDSWLEGIIRPIYKRKGNPLQPENYRPITILSCFGKLFTSILNTRLYNYLEQFNILEENQAGFRAGYSTTDHMFVLHSLTELLKTKKKKLFCSFIDFSKAFDSVWRIGLWKKLLGNGINGKIFRIIYNMYQNIKSCVSFSGEKSNVFRSFRGVRQGENMSPVLFALFLNDLETYLVQNNCRGVDIEFSNEQLYLYLKLFILLYADDTVVFGTDEKSFQDSLSAFYEYSNIWKLDINFSKTKIMIFGTRNDDRFQFKLGDNIISICKEFKYLGIIFSKNRSFYAAMKHNCDQARKAMFLLYKRIRNLNLPTDLQIQLFDHTILPIMLYGCEIWGFQNTKLVENLHNDFLRTIVKLKKSTPIYMIHAELGRMPLDININSRMIGYWISVVNSNQLKLSKQLYNILLNETISGNYEHKWITSIKQILTSVGRMDLFNADFINNPRAVKRSINRTLSDIYIQEWKAKADSSSKAITYFSFKQDIKFENYLASLPRNSYLPLIKFRTGNHKLPVETGRWENIPLNERKCSLCNLNDIGDEFHYLFKCTYFSSERNELLKAYFYKRPNILKFSELLTSNNEACLKRLSKFVNIIMNKFS